MNKSKMIIAVVGAIAVVGSIAPIAHAADPTDVTVTGGSLTITNPTVADFTGITLDGTAQQGTAAMDAFDVSDARGTGEGWNVTIGATQFAEWATGAYVASGKTLPSNSLSLPQLTAAKIDGSSSAIPSVIAGPYTIDSGSSFQVASAAADGTGMGGYTFSQGGPLTLSVPAGAYARTYRSDVTVSVNTGP